MSERKITQSGAANEANTSVGLTFPSSVVATGVRGTNIYEMVIPLTFVPGGQSDSRGLKRLYVECDLWRRPHERHGLERSHCDLPCGSVATT